MLPIKAFTGLNGVICVATNLREDWGSVISKLSIPLLWPRTGGEFILGRILCWLKCSKLCIFQEVVFGMQRKVLDLAMRGLVSYALLRFLRRVGVGELVMVRVSIFGMINGFMVVRL